jgi:hypothetical protein
MHEPFQPKCSHCAKFVYCFPKDSLLADWGYCVDGMSNGPPTSEELRALEEAAQQGKYALLFSPDVPFYQETDDGCAHYVPL